MRLFGSKKRKAVTMAVNCLLGAAVFAGGLLADAEVAGAAEPDPLPKYINGKKDGYLLIVADNPDYPLEFYSPEDAPTGAVEYAGEPKIAGGYSETTAVENAKVIIHGGDFDGEVTLYFYGGRSKYDVTGNTLTISGGYINTGEFYGGYSDTSGTSTGNTVTVSGGTFKAAAIYGGCAKVGNVTNNTVTISDGTFNSSFAVAGGYSEGGAASDNTVNISGGTFNEATIYGGYAYGDVTNNTVNITAACDLSTVDIYGGVSSGGGTVSGNTLNIKACGIKAKTISAFNNLNFYVPAAAVNGDTMLTVDAADITGSTIKAGVATGAGLKKDDKINLLKATFLDGEAASMKADLTGTGLVEIDADVKKDGNSIVLIMNEDINKQPDPGPTPPPDPKPDPKPKKLKEESKSLVETRAGGMALLNTAFDLTTGKGFANAQAAAEAESDAAANDGVTKNTEGVRAKAGFTPYAAIGGANMRYETGSYVDSKGWGANIGFSRIINYQNSRLTLAPFVEYGKASYDSYLNNGTHGSGDNSFTGIGFIVKNEQKDGLYYEGSVRLGRVKGDYQGDASTYGSNYDTASNYLAFHAGIGKVQKLNDKNSIDYYGKFFYTHQNGDTVNIHSTLGDAMYDFDAINSYRLRLGARWSQKLGKRDKLYAGLAWDYEFDSEARAHYNGMSTPAPTMKGSSGMLELGWKQEATKDNPFGVDLGLTGWCGKQRGITFNAGFSFGF